MNFIRKKEMLRMVENRLMKQLKDKKEVLAEAKAKGIEEFHSLVDVKDMKEMTQEDLEWQVERAAIRDRISEIDEEVALLKDEMFKLELAVSMDKSLTRDTWEKRLERKLSRPDLN